MEGKLPFWVLAFPRRESLAGIAGVAAAVRRRSNGVLGQNGLVIAEVTIRQALNRLVAL